MAGPWGGQPAEGQKDLPGTCSTVFSPTGVGRQAHSHEPWTVNTEENAQRLVWELGGPGKGRKQRQEQNK